MFGRKTQQQQLMAAKQALRPVSQAPSKVAPRNLMIARSQLKPVTKPVVQSSTWYKMSVPNRAKQFNKKLSMMNRMKTSLGMKPKQQVIKNGANRLVVAQAPMPGPLPQRPNMRNKWKKAGEKVMVQQQYFRPTKNMGKMWKNTGRKVMQQQALVPRVQQGPSVQQGPRVGYNASSLRELSQTIAKLNMNKSNAQMKARQLNSNEAQMMAQVNAMMSQAAANKANANKRVTNMRNLQAQLNAKQRELNSVKAKMNANKTQLNNLKSRVDQTRGQKSTLTQEYNSLQKQYNAAKGQMATLKKSMGL